MKKISLMFCFLLLLAGIAFAGIPVNPAQYTGFRTTPPANGVDATNGYTETNGGLRIAWEIEFDTNIGFWKYKYTFTNSDGSTPISPDISHWILEISPDIPFDDISSFIFDTNFTLVTPPMGNPWPADPAFPDQTQAGANGGNPNLGTDLYGFKLDTPSQAVSGIYTFKSTQPPVWGDFYVK